MRTSEQIDQIAAALAKAHADYKPIKRTTKGQVGQNREYLYAPLDTVIEATFPALLQHGIVPIQAMDGETGLLVTRVVHVSGQWIESSCPLGSYTRPQELGSALSYIRRYSLMALLGVAQEDDDDDGASAQQGKPATRQRPAQAAQPATSAPVSQPTSSAARVISEPQLKRLWVIFKQHDLTEADFKAQLTKMGLEHTKDLLRDHYDDMISWIEGHGKRQG